MDIFNELRERAMDAAQTLGQQVTSIASDVGQQMASLAVDVGQQVSSLAVDVGQHVSSYAGDISASVNGILARAFNDFVRLLATCETKEEEDMVVQSELGRLKKVFREGNLKGDELRDTLIRMVYCEMLGYEVPYGYLKAIELCSDTNIINKKAGYIASATCIPPDHEFRFMVVNRIQIDLQSKNHLEVCTAIIACSQLLTADMIPALSQLAGQLIHHKEAVVQKKAIMLIQRFHQLDPTSVDHLIPDLKTLLKSRDPNVYFTTLTVLHDFVKEDASQFKDLVEFFCQLLEQIVGRQLPTSFYYKEIPAPWFQMKLLRILAYLGNADQQASEKMYKVITYSLQQASQGFPRYICCSIAAECIFCATHIYPNETLFQQCAKVVERLVFSTDPNVLYLGLSCCGDMLIAAPTYVLKFQIQILRCLQSEDPSMRYFTLTVLEKMCNNQNVDVIVSKFLDALRGTYDPFQRQVLVDRICTVAERFAPNPSWFINVMCQVFALGGRQVSRENEKILIHLLSESQGDPDLDLSLRVLAVQQLYPLLLEPLVPENIIRVTSWVLGEYAQYCEDPSLPDVVETLSDIWHRPALCAETKEYIMTAFMKISSQTQTVPNFVVVMVKESIVSRDNSLVQLALNFKEMYRLGSSVFSAAIPTDENKLAEDNDVDFNLTFLNDYVNDARIEGKPEYNPPESFVEEEAAEEPTTLKTDAYEAYEDPYAAASKPQQQKMNDTLDFSAIKGTFGFGAPAQNKEDDMFGGMSPEPTGDASTLFSTGNSTFGPSSSAPAEESDDDMYEDEGEYVDERTQEANALFGGISMAKQAQKKKKTTKPVKRTNKTMAELGTKMTLPQEDFLGVGGTSPQVDMFGGMSPAPANDGMDMFGGMSPAPANDGGMDMFGGMSPASAANSGMDMFGGMNMMGSAPVNNGGMDMFGGMNMMGSAPVNNGGMDMLGGMNMMGSAPAASSGDIFSSMSVPMSNSKPAPSKPVANIDMKKCRLCPAHAKTMGKDPSLPVLVVLPNNGTIFLSYDLIFSESRLVVALFCKSATDLSSFTCDLECTPGLATKYILDPKGTSTKGHVVLAEPLAAEKQVSILCAVNFQKATPSSQLYMKGTINYVEASGVSGSHSFTVNFNFADMLRPVPMSVSQFNETFASLKSESKVVVKTNIKTPSTFADKFRNMFRITAVDINDLSYELMFAGKVAGTQHNCLFLCQGVSTGVYVIVKTASSVLTKLVCDALTHL